MYLLIVESPTKAKKIKSMLGNEFEVLASLGHIRDLPEKTMGVYPPDYKPSYVLTDTGKKVMARIRDAAKKAERIFLASDPDREGEAIGWHIAQVLKLKKTERVVYNEITESAIRKALNAARPIDINLVNAQETRRVIDRLVGYRVSPVLSSALNEPASSGRVQTPALLLIVSREQEIRNFKSVLHFGCEFTFQGGWKATWNTKNWLQPEQRYILERSYAEQVSSVRSFRVVSCKEGQVKQGPPAPYITSTLQRAGEKSLGITIKDVMGLAQKLFEAGHITYMRTDSPVLSVEAVEQIRSYCSSRGWPVVDAVRKWKVKGSAQEAHEAIRPTHIEVENAGETELEQALYRLIWLRTIATQLPDAIFAVRNLELQGTSEDGKEVLLSAKGKVKLSPGWTALMASAAEEELDAEGDEQFKNPTPMLQENAVIAPIANAIQEKKTSPPSRYSESSLVDELERRGIGRPATYSAILETLYGSHFAVLNKKIITPTPLGEKVISTLNERFFFVNLDFTKQLEEFLDKVSEGKQTYIQVIKALDNRLTTELQNFMTALGYASCPRCNSHMRPSKKISICTSLNCSPDLPCPKCGKVTRFANSAKGSFMSCIDYPECKGMYTFENGQPTIRAPKK